MPRIHSTTVEELITLMLQSQLHLIIRIPLLTQDQAMIERVQITK